MVTAGGYEERSADGDLRNDISKGSLYSQVASILALTVFALGSRLLLLPSTVDGLDSVQQALALIDYDLANHTPHPPGAPAYHAVVRLVNLFADSPTGAVLATGVLLSALAGLAAWGLGVTMPGAGGRRYPGVTGFLLLVSPALWIDSVSGGSAMGDAALAAAVGLFSFRARATRRPLDAVTSAVLLGVLVGFRQNANLASFCMLPVWFWCVWPLRLRH